MAEIQVYPLEPEVGKCYEHVEATRKVGSYPTRYFTTNTPRYVGMYLHSEKYYHGDSGARYDYFEDETGHINEIRYSYEGNTIFREVPCRSRVGGKSKRRRTRNLKKRTKTKRRNLKRK